MLTQTVQWNLFLTRNILHWRFNYRKEGEYKWPFSGLCHTRLIVNYNFQGGISFYLHSRIKIISYIKEFFGLENVPLYNDFVFTCKDFFVFFPKFIRVAYIKFALILGSLGSLKFSGFKTISTSYNITFSHNHTLQCSLA